MCSFNKVILVGNLCQDPELRYFQSGTAHTRFTIGVNRYYTSNGEKRQEASFVDVEVWGKRAETVSKYFAKGKGILVEGRLQQQRWEDKATGQKRSKIIVVMENFQFQGGTKPHHEDEQPLDYEGQAPPATEEDSQDQGLPDGL